METGPFAADDIVAGAATVGSVEAVVDISGHAVGVGDIVSPVVGVVVTPIAHGVEDRAPSSIEGLAHNVVPVK